MNSDIRINTSFLQHPKTVKLRKRLGDSAVISLLSLWCFVAQNRPEGVLFGMDEEDIEIASQWVGESGIFIKTLISLRWVDQEDGTFLIHDWKANNPWVADAENRSEKAKKAVKTRWEREKQRQEDIKNSYASNTQVIQQNEVSNTPFLSLPSLTKTLNTEEEHARGKMSMSDIQQLHVKYLGKIPQNQPVVSVLIDLCRDYPAERITVAFQAAAASAEKPNLKWIKSYLDNPKNWNKELRQPQSRGQPKTFDQIRTENNRQAAIDFVEGNYGDGFGQKTICHDDERNRRCIPV